MNRSLLVALALSTLGVPARGAELDLERWLAEPGVRLVAVDFYAEYCAPCMDAVPRWEALRKRRQRDGLKLVVVNHEPTKPGCPRLPWRPDENICDLKGEIGTAFGFRSLPAAYLWSWQGNLLVEGDHIDAVERAIRRYLAVTPRVLVEAVDRRGRKDAKLTRLFEAELGRHDKLEVVSDAATRKKLAKIRRASHDPSKRDIDQCPLGQEVAANSLLAVEQMGDQLSVRLVNAVTGCQQGIFAPWDRRKPVKSVAAAVHRIMNGLVRKTPQMPGGDRRRATRTRIEERVIQGSDDGWTAESSAAQLALIRFESDPPGAAVAVDGKALCDATPCNKALVSGPHQVEMTLPDYLPLKKRVTLEKSRLVSFRLEPNFALVTVTSRPSGLPVIIDGNRVGQTPQRDLRLTAGAHEFLIDEGCHRVASQTIEVERGQKRKVALKTEPRRAGIQVLAEDSAGDAVEAAVWVDGVRVGEALEPLTVPLCSRALRVESVGLGAWSLDLSGPRLAERETASVTVTLRRALTTGSPSDLQLPKGVRAGARGTGSEVWKGSLLTQLKIAKFTSRPEGAQVLVDGKPVCSTPCRRAFAPGDYLLKMRKARYVDRRGPLRVMAGRGAAVSWKLEPDFGTVSIHSTPPGLQVLVDGEERGTTPLKGLSLSSGPHRVELSDRCFHRSGEELVVARGSTRKLVLRPETRKAGVAVLAKDAKGEDLAADVLVDGQVVGETPGTFTVPMCSRVLEVRHTELGSWLTELTLREKETARVDAELFGATGSARPPWAPWRRSGSSPP
jgi:thiol-disulfide isomerase/thioredoxin